MASVAELRPDSKGVTLTVKVADAKVVITRPKTPKGPGLRVAECIVGDSTGSIVLVVKNDQVDAATKGATLTLSNAKVEMFRGSMRLAVPESSGKVEAAEGDVKPNLDNNMSLLEFELVTVGGPQ